MYQLLTVLAPADLADSVAAAAAHLDAAATDIRTVDDAALPSLLALLALGRTRTVRELLRPTARPVGPREDAAAAATALHPSAEPAALAALLGRYHAWTGDTSVARTLWSQLQSLATTQHDPVRTSAYGQGLTGRQIVIAMAARNALERMAPDVGHAPAAAAFRAAARELGNGLPGNLSADDRILAAALGVDAAAAASGPPPPEPSVDDVAMTILHFATSVLGLDPDAPRHRLGLRPVLRPLKVRDIPFADGSVSLDVEPGQPGEWHLRLEQESGAIPVTAVLEPFLPRWPAAENLLAHPPAMSPPPDAMAGSGPPHATAFVDDRPAQLVPRLVPGGVVLPVQLVLDAPRRLAIYMQEGRSP